MPQKALVLINIEIGSEEEVLSKLREIPNIKETYLVYGVYDIVAVIEAQTQDELREIVVKHVRRIPKIRSTTTMMVIEEFKK
ncbi:MAG: Lrp/AsnC ligand binding domain-containing protein [Sulfolobales archaeon]